MHRVILNFLFLLFLHQVLVGQEIPIGSWQSHLPYQQGTSITQSDTKIIYSTPLAVFTIDKTDMSTTFLSKVEGLSDIGIEKVRYDRFNDQLFIIYTNSNIDIVKDNEIINISNIFSNTSIVGNKRVNDIYFENAGSAFFSADFGIVQFNPRDLTFGVTIQTGVPVNNMSSSDDILFAASAEGVYFIDRSLENIIADFNNWNFLGKEQGLPSVYNSKDIESHKGVIYIGADAAIYKADDTRFTWKVIHEEPEQDLQFITSTEDRLIVGWTGTEFKSEVLFFDDSEAFIEKGNNCIGVPVDALRDETGKIWYADLFNNIRSSNDYNSSCTQISFNSPFSDKASDIVLKDDQVLIASGGVAENFTFLFSREGFYLESENQWTNFNEFENSAIRGFDLLSVFRVAFHPTLQKLYAGSYWAGLLEYDQETDQYSLFNKTNSTIRGSIGDPQRERISGLAFDNEENLWVAAYNAPEPINVLTPEGDWLSFDVPSLGTLSDIVIDDLGYKWFPVHGSNGGVLVYDSGASVQSKADDRFRFITTNNSELTTNNVLSVVVDLDGEVWVGTNEGPVLFDCGTQVFEESLCRGVRRKVVQDSIVAFLLADQQINVMAVDGADRKWFGTRTGLFVQSPQGEQQIDHFTTNNSPLFDNEITALGFNGTTGEMWIGTNKGIQLYRTSTTTGGNFHNKNEVYAFPNPVDPSYRGPIAIKGLVTNANVKITDVNGLLVAELSALGGQAIWDGLDQKGREVASGVYLVFSTDVEAFDRPDSFVTKIMVLR